MSVAIAQDTTLTNSALSRQHKIDALTKSGITPMMAQYTVIKDDHPDAILFYRMGDFYELFFDDAVLASDFLGITLTRRGKTEGTDIPMCGVPYHSYEPYLAKLIRAGHKVAICEQTETPQEAKDRAKRDGRPASKSLVNRDVVRVVTQGTLTEDNLLDPSQNNFLCSLYCEENSCSVAWLDITTGVLNCEEARAEYVHIILDRINPSEIIVHDNSALYRGDRLAPFKAIITPLRHDLYTQHDAHKRLLDSLGINTLESYGTFSECDINALHLLTAYVARTQKGKLPHINPPIKAVHGATMDIDATTRKSLELTQTLQGERKGSLLHTLDRTRSNAGARLLQNWLSAPLTEPATINQRLDYVSHFIAQTPLHDSVCEMLHALPDIERAVSRVTLGRAGPKDLAAIRNGLSDAEIIRAEMQHNPQTATLFADPLQHLTQKPSVSALHDYLKKALDDAPVTLTRDGGFIKHGFSAKLDNLRDLRDNSRSTIAALQKTYREISTVDQLKIKHNNVLGFFIEVPSKKADGMMVKAENNNDANPFIHRQTLANVVRFTTPELAELERDITSAATKIIAIEIEIFNDMADHITQNAAALNNIAQALAMIDVTTAFATLAQDMGYVRPTIDNSYRFTLTEARHPVVEAALKKQSETFMPNDCALNEDERLWLLTGPNMAGKSTFLRQNALIAIMAHIGCFVPARSAHIGVIDKVFSRVGASDDLARGQSTFMVEMVETASILNQSTVRSLVILDEIGRGTATYDGLSIAWACIEYLHSVNQCRALFATHYHELTTLEQTLDHVCCYTVQVKEWKDNVIFMHKVIRGQANKSYGIHVAKLAGLPDAVIKHAETILKTLEAPHMTQGFEDRHATQTQLPLFAAAPAESIVDKALADIDPDTLSPREALDALYTLRALQKL